MATKVCATLSYVTTLALTLSSAPGCRSGDSGSEGPLESTQQALGTGDLSSANLQLQVLTNSCGANQAQQFFQILNSTGAAVKLSDLQVKFWLDDTSAGTTVAASINTPGCVTNAGNPSCVHLVPSAKATINATKLPSACGPDANHQANWEIAISYTDTYAIPAGGTLTNLQAALHLANYGNFSPGTSKWYSPCLTGSSYTADSHFGVYYKGNLVYASGINAPDCRAPHGQQRLPGYVVPPVSTAPIAGTVPGSTVVSLAVGVPSQDPDGLKVRAQQVSDPSSPQYRNYLTVSDFAATYGATTSNYQGLANFLTSKGLSLVATYPNNLLMTVSGTAAALGQTLQANLVYRQRPDGSQFVSVDRDPSPDTAFPVLWISGLTDFVASKPASGTGEPGCGTMLCSTYYFNTDLRNAYALPTGGKNVSCSTTLAGQGQNLGIYSESDYDKSDIDTFKKVAGIDVNVENVVSGKQPPNTHYKGEQEVDSDIETAISMAPKLDNLFVFESLSPAENLHAIASHLPLVNQVSCSWLIETDPNLQYALLEMAAQGQSLFTASGDTFIDDVTLAAYDIRKADWVTVVGATKLTMNGKGESYASEIPALWSVGGVTDTDLPKYQEGMDWSKNGGSSKHRNFPDVSIDGDLGAAYWAAKWGEFVGTSMSSPLWAGFMALVNQQAHQAGLNPVGFVNPAIYAIGKNPDQYAATFNDATDPTQSYGNNAYYAVPGFDLVTGWGSPTCALIATLANTSSPAPTCQTGQSVCWGVCSDLQSDPNNCGVCGQACGGGLCKAGVCQPMVIASGVAGVSRIAVDAAHVYVTALTSSGGNPAGRVLMTSLDGTGGLQTVASNQTVPNSLVVNGTALYWSTFGSASASGGVASSGTIMAWPFSGSPVTLASGLSQPGPIAVDAQNVYFPLHAPVGQVADYTKGSLMKVSAQLPTGVPAAPQTVLAPLQGIDFTSLAPRSGNVFWASLADHERTSLADALVCGGATAGWNLNPWSSVIAAINACPKAQPSGGIFATALNSPAIRTIVINDSPVSLITGVGLVDSAPVWLDNPEASPSITENRGRLRFGVAQPTGPWAVYTQATGLNRPQNLAMDAVNFYWSEAPHYVGAFACGTIKRCRASGNDADLPMTLAFTGAATAISGLAVRDNFVYWTDDANGGEIMRVAVPFPFAPSPEPDVAVTVGHGHACAIRPDKSISCWGSNGSGQLGNSAASNPQLTPVAVNGLAGRTAYSAAAGGSHTCVVLSNGAVWCWGSNTHGQFGNGTKTSANVAVQSGFTNAQAVVAGSSHTCAVETDGGVTCAGSNMFGQAGASGLPEGTDVMAPVTVMSYKNAGNLVGLGPVFAIAAGGNHACAVVGSDLHVECWGQVVPHTLVWTPYAIAPPGPPDGHQNTLTGVRAIAAGQSHNCAVIGSSGRVECWGDDSGGRLGDWGTLPLGSPGAPPVVEYRDWPDPDLPVLSCSDNQPLVNAIGVAVGEFSSCALMAGGTVQCWGDGLGCAAPVQGLTGVTEISSGGSMTCARPTNGIWCWGAGVLGDGGAERVSNVPVSVQF